MLCLSVDMLTIVVNTDFFKAPPLVYIQKCGHPKDAIPEMQLKLNLLWLEGCM